MDTGNAIEIRNISKTFRIKVEDKSKRSSLINRNPVTTKTVKVIDDISLDIRKGDVLGILGRNGAGKSTLLSLIARIMEPDSGTIEFSGKLATILELGMGFHPDMSGRENIYLKGELYGFTRKQLDEKIEQIIDYSGIRDFIDNPVRTYSSGMSGRLAFAIMVNVDASIMLVDEILSVGDVAFSSKASEHFKRMATSGKTVVFVSHNVSFVESMCNRVIWIEDGKIFRDGPSKAVCAEYQNMMNESPEVILDLAQAGVVEFQYKLAKMYKEGINFNQNYEQYRLWLQKASIQGHTRAQIEYGDILMEEGSQADAMIHYISAAKRGDVEARMRVASIYSRRSNCLSSLVAIYEKYVTCEDPLIEFRFAELLSKIAFTDEGRKKAFDYYLLSANHGYPNAMFKVGVMYRDGIGVKRDVKTMEVYLVKSAMNGFVPAMKLLYDIYSSGRLLPKNDEMAHIWIKKAAELGDVDSMYKLAMLYFDKDGSSFDVTESEKWLDRHFDASLQWYYVWGLEMYDADYPDMDFLNAFINSFNPMAINRCIMSSISNEESIEKYIDILSNLASNNNIDAIRRLGTIFYDGIGINQDYKRALELYEKSANLGDLWSKIRVGDMYRDGKGTVVNIDKAISMYENASYFGSVSAIGNIIDICASGMVVNDVLLNSSIEKMKFIANSGNSDACNHMGNLYYDGKGVRRNYSEAYLWYEKSAKLGNSWAKNRIQDIERNHASCIISHPS